MLRAISGDVVHAAAVDLREELGGAGGDPHEGYDLVTERMQDALSALGHARMLPLIG